MEQSKHKIEEPRPIVIFFQGIPGLGKNTVGNYILTNYPEYQWFLIDQDAFNGNTKKCQQAFNELIKKNSNILLVRNNACEEQYIAYLAYLKDVKYRIIFIYPNEAFNDQKKNLLPICKNAVKNRPEHLLNKLPVEKRVKILYIFISKF